MAEFDRLIVRLIAEMSLQHPDVLDVAVSSCVTTTDLRKAFRESGLEPSIVATDLAIEASIVNVAPGICALVDAKGRPLQFDCFGLAVRAWSRRVDCLSGYWLLRAWLRRLRTNPGSPQRQKVRPISRLAVSEGIAFVEDDLSVFNPAPAGRFDVVRAANVLNRAYFPKQTIAGMISNLKRYCRGPGALIAINRTHLDGANHGSILSLQADDSLSAIARVGDGAEVEALALVAA